uniref:Uncharacterized protein n=1 Tax=Wuchereria bancrofti TaxID=6293 RepID=A0AAF5PX17_WUCBA
MKCLLNNCLLLHILYIYIN